MDRAFFEKEINAQNHVVILISEENGKYWLHTRGMAKFGRPDISIANVCEEEIEDSKQVIGQMIYYGGQGVFFQDNVKLHIHNGKSYVVNAEFIDDFDNVDFNNAYYKVMILEEV